MFKTQFAAAALSLALTGGLFAASTGAHAEQVLVHYGDLDLSTQQGQVALEKRLNAAARKACDYDKVVTGTILRAPGAAQCYHEARAKAKDQMAAIVSDTRLGG